MTIRGIIFDLDGTLVDTLRDIADSVNHVLTIMGLPTHPIDAFRHMVGNGSKMLIARSLGPDRQYLFDDVLKQQQQYYPLHMCDYSRPYPGVVDLLAELKSRSIKMAVLSNKPHQHTKTMIEQLFAPHTFDVIIGQRPDVPLKPDPAAAVEILNRLNLPADQTAMIGDTPIDMQFAKNAGLIPVGVTWGFRPREELTADSNPAIIDHPSQFLSLL